MKYGFFWWQLSKEMGRKGYVSARCPTLQSCSGGQPPEASCPERVLEGPMAGQKETWLPGFGRFSGKGQEKWSSSIWKTLHQWGHRQLRRPSQIKLWSLSHYCPSALPPIKRKKMKVDPETNTTSFSFSKIYSKVRNKEEVKTQNSLSSSKPSAKEKSLKLGMRLQHETEMTKIH